MAHAHKEKERKAEEEKKAKQEAFRRQKQISEEIENQEFNSSWSNQRQENEIKEGKEFL